MWWTTGYIQVLYSMAKTVKNLRNFTVIYTENSQAVFPRYGTTSFLATVVLPRDHTRTQNTLAALNDSCGKTGHGAVLEGIHSEVYNFFLPILLSFPPHYIIIYMAVDSPGL